MDMWRKVWREGIVPQMTRERLLALKTALETDDERLVQGATTIPRPILEMQDRPVEAACAISYAYWKGDKIGTVIEVEDAFCRSCGMIDEAMGEPAASRWFLNWFDETPRAEMRAKLLEEVELSLAPKRDAYEEYILASEGP